MKLSHFEHKTGYIFQLLFSDHSHLEVDLAPLLAHHIQPEHLVTAQIDPDWGCLVFNDGMVDIEPKTLYRFAHTQHQTNITPH